MGNLFISVYILSFIYFCPMTVIGESVSDITLPASLIEKVSRKVPLTVPHRTSNIYLDPCKACEYTS